MLFNPVYKFSLNNQKISSNFTGTDFYPITSVHTLITLKIAFAKTSIFIINLHLTQVHIHKVRNKLKSVVKIIEHCNIRVSLRLRLLVTDNRLNVETTRT